MCVELSTPLILCRWGEWGFERKFSRFKNWISLKLFTYNHLVWFVINRITLHIHWITSILEHTSSVFVSSECAVKSRPALSLTLLKPSKFDTNTENHTNNLAKVGPRIQGPTFASHRLSCVALSTSPQQSLFLYNLLGHWSFIR